MYNRSIDPAYRAVKLSEIFDAIERDGLPQIRNWFYQYKYYGKSDLPRSSDDPILGTCALGQAAVNLDTDAMFLYDEINRIDPIGIGDIISGWNDTGLTYGEIAKRGREDFSDHLDKEVYIRI